MPANVLIVAAIDGGQRIPQANPQKALVTRQPGRGDHCVPAHHDSRVDSR
jgi:hypothetical protein